LSECTLPSKKRTDSLTLTILAVIAVITIVGVILTPWSDEILAETDSVIYILLTLATDVLYLLGGLVVFFGALLVTVRFIQCKLSDPYKPSCVTRFLSGYLTLSLEFFIGAEIIKTTVTRTTQEFELLILVIVSRGLFSLILYLERRWHGGAETE